MAKDNATDRTSDVVDNVDAEAAEDRARAEALNDRGALADRDRQQRADVKAGKRTGVTDQFGALEFGQSKDAARVSVERNDRQLVSRVEYPDHTSRSFEYSGYGANQLMRVTDQNGWSWRREDAGWQLYNSNGERTAARLEGTMMVDREGNFTFLDKDGTKEISRADGSYRREYKNGSFERNAQDQVTMIKDANESKRFEYGPDGRLMREVHEDGTSWRRDRDGWHHYDANGKRGEALAGDIEVDTQGNYIFRHNDGMRETTGADGSYVRHEANGEVSRVTYPDGSRKFFIYSEGRLDSCINQDGTSWRREAGSWILYDNQRPPRRTNERLQGDIEVDRQGNFTFVHRDGTRETTGPDKRVTRTPPPRR